MRKIKSLFILFAVLCLNVNTALATPVDIIHTVNGYIRSVNFAGCEVSPITLSRGVSYSTEIDFQTFETVESLELVIYIKFLGEDKFYGSGDCYLAGTSTYPIAAWENCIINFDLTIAQVIPRMGTYFTFYLMDAMNRTIVSFGLAAQID